MAPKPEKSRQQPEIEHQADQGRFILIIDGENAFLRYSKTDDRTLDFFSTFVPPNLRQQGIGERIVRFALEYAKKNDYKVNPSCWFVKKIMERDHELAKLMS